MPNYCDNHFEVVRGLNEITEKADHAVVEVQAMRVEQTEFQEHQRTWMGQLDQKLDAFIDTTDQEIRGGHGPDGKPGMKQIIHDNKNQITKLAKSVEESQKPRINWLPLVAAAVLNLLGIIVAAVFLYHFLEGK
jgi:hypothetical protein